MRTVNENGEVISLYNIHERITSLGETKPGEYVWIFDTKARDFMLSKLNAVIKHTVPIIHIYYNGSIIRLPTSWYVVVYDSDTSEIDVIPVTALMGRRFDLLGLTPDSYKPVAIPATAINYNTRAEFFTPSLLPEQMACIATNSNLWICAGPNEQCTNYLKQTVVGDLF